MAAKRVMVEINLTSNDVILNIKGADHPLPMYRLYHVPVALSTDDEGVSRIDLTHEYVRAAMTYPLTYGDFKQMVRTALEHSFLAGDSLWEQPGPWESYAHPRAACRTQLGRGRLREHAHRCSRPAKRHSSSSSWNGDSRTSKIHIGFCFFRVPSFPDEDGCPISRSFFARCGIPLFFPFDPGFIRCTWTVNLGGIPRL